MASRARSLGKIRIISRSSEPFRDRAEAGRRLGEALGELGGKHSVVLGIPRGGIIVARELAKAIDAEFDMVLSRKLRAPGQPELAIGSVAEGGKVFINNLLVMELGVDEGYIQQEIRIQMVEIERRSKLIRSVLPKVPLEGRIAVVTDDGVATGATTQAAIWAVKQDNPGRLIAAMPVGSKETINRLAEDVDEMVCLRVPPFFQAVGQFYTWFEQVEDDDIFDILEEERKRKTVR